MVINIRRAISSLSNKISTANNYNEEQAEQVEYVLRVMIYEIIKIIGVLSIFSFLGYSKEILVFMLIIVTSKPFCGGLHFSHQISCFVSELIFASGAIYMGTTITLNILSVIIISIFCLFCVWSKIPVQDPSMPMTRKDLIDSNRKRGLTLIGVFFALIIVLGCTNISNIFTQVGIWTILIHTMLLFQKREFKIKNKNIEE